MPTPSAEWRQRRLHWESLLRLDVVVGRYEASCCVGLAVVMCIAVLLPGFHGLALGSLGLVQWGSGRCWATVAMFSAKLYREEAVSCVTIRV